MSDYAAYFLDVQAGDNRLTQEATCCYAGPNYDMASGLGSLQPAPFLQFLKGIQAASHPAP